MIIKLNNSYAIQEQKKAVKLLKKFKSNLPKDAIAIIAGGAPRDWHHGWGCRDIDIFYYIPDQKPLTYLCHKTNEQKPCHLDIPKLKQLGENNQYFNYDCDDTGFGAILSIHEYQIRRKNAALHLRNVQLIELKIPPLDYVKLFPISLSQIYMDDTGKIESLHAYDCSYEYKIIYELHRKSWNYVYLDKILGRFCDYGFLPYKWSTRNKHMAGNGMTYNQALAETIAYDCNSTVM